MSNSGLKQAARSYMLKNAPKLFFITIIYLAVITLLPILSAEVSGVRDVVGSALEQVYQGKLPPDWSRAVAKYRPFGVLLSVVIVLFMNVIDVGYRSYALNVSRGQGGDYKDLLDGFTMAGKIILLSIVRGLFTLLWSLLLIVPGIVAAYRYSQAYYVLLDHPEFGVMDCIRESKKLMSANKLDLFILDLSFLGWLILSVIVEWYIVVPVVMIWVQPYMSVTQAGFYNYLIRYNPEADAGTP